MGARARATILLLTLAVSTGGCYTARMQRMEQSLGTLETKADADSASLSEMRKDLAEQKDLLLSLKAGSNTTSKELVDRLEELSSKLDDTVQRMSNMRPPVSYRASWDTAQIGFSSQPQVGPPPGSVSAYRVSTACLRAAGCSCRR